MSIYPKQVNKEILTSYAEHVSLFGDQNLILLPNSISETEDIFSKEILTTCQNSDTVFLFVESKLLADDLKTYQKYTKDVFKYDEVAKKEKANPFLLTDLFARKDKIGAWTTYMNLIEGGESAEAISGMLFWRIKTAILKNEKLPLSQNELMGASRELVSMYHSAHNGESELAISVEQFILKTL